MPETENRRRRPRLTVGHSLVAIAIVLGGGGLVALAAGYTLAKWIPSTPGGVSIRIRPPGVEPLPAIVPSYENAPVGRRTITVRIQ